MNKNDQQFLVEKIRTQYTEKEYTQLDELKALDRKVKKPANVFGYVWGIIGTLVMGAGMSFAMDVIEAGTYLGLITIGENMMPAGIVIGLIGIVMVCLTWPLYKRILERRRKKYAGQIIALSDKIAKNE